MEFCGKKAWLVLMGVMVVLCHVLGTNGCFEEERNALLDLKDSYGNESYVLASWLNDPKSNCCSWERVTCSSSSGHIIHLALGNLHTKESGMEVLGFPYGEMGPYISPMRSLNWSLFLPLRELRSLGLSNLCFLGFVPNQDYQSKSRLKKLGTLDLSFNYLNESIMEVLSALPSIKSLVMAANFIGGPFPMKELTLLPNLEMLDLSGNRLVSYVPNQGMYFVLLKVNSTRPPTWVDLANLFLKSSQLNLLPCQIDSTIELRWLDLLPELTWVNLHPKLTRLEFRPKLTRVDLRSNQHPFRANLSQPLTQATKLDHQ
ncbi:hypothetical protein V8G54_027644 [Vigna mungo]|uniref:Leucine-rich repeat-containing N-terminal plant-type domain-containing protein n=1 Tax=Vigna mungo TaxID=3915 RepID=A0AAQ3N180_VIGMU